MSGIKRHSISQRVTNLSTVFDSNKPHASNVCMSLSNERGLFHGCQIIGLKSKRNLQMTRRVHKIKDCSDHGRGTKEPVNQKKVDKVEIYVILIREPNISDFGRGAIIDFKYWVTRLPKSNKFTA